jgi:hypothetical protein
MTNLEVPVHVFYGDPTPQEALGFFDYQAILLLLSEAKPPGVTQAVLLKAES